MRFPNKCNRSGQGESSIIIRPGMDCDSSFITRLSKDVFDIYGPYDKIVPAWFLSKNAVTIIAERHPDPVGFAMLGGLSNRYDLGHASELLAIAVDEKEQGKGIGELLLDAIEKMAMDLDIKRIFLHTALGNNPAQKLFKRVGYQPWEIKRRFYPRGQDAVVMSKEPSEA